MSQSNPTFYVLHGSDEFTRAEMVAAFRERLGPPDVIDLNTAFLDGRRVTWGELRHACESIPFLAERRLVVVTGLLTRLHKTEGEFLKSVLALLPGLPETTRLVFVEEGSLPANHPVLKLSQQHERGYARLFEPPTDKALPGWVTNRVQKEGGSIDPRAAFHLAQIVGNDLRLLNQEIVKLVTYVGPGAEIMVEDVTTLVPYAQEAIIFDLVDAMGQRNGRTAATLLQRLLDAGEHEMGILGMVVRQFRLLVQVKELRQAGENAASIAQALHLHPFPAGKLYQQATNFTAHQLEHIYRHLLALDVQIKRGEITPEMALDLLVAALAGAT
ncbi:MAG: DNA polymerase III subunit delta [Anaerolineae bacterium]|nr:DNA polymerase III subunit delta [Anaerolineae bacterium]